MTKVCNKCKILKTSDNFTKRKLKNGLGLTPYCKLCTAARAKKYKKYNSQVYKLWYAGNPDRNKNYKLIKNYGITIQDYYNLLKSQNFKCKICFNSSSNSKLSSKLFVDHCHKTNKVRGLLCDACNKGLGLFKDNIELLKNSISYLENKNAD